MKLRLALLLGLLPGACSFQAAVPHPHYVLGAAYQADGVWHYPRRRLDLVATGLATVIPAGHPALTADGEAFEQDALAAASPDLQLPAIARLTDLANGRLIEVRINDRGPADPARLVAVTRRVARALGLPGGGVAPVRLHVLAGPSQVAEAALPGAPLLALTAAPVRAVLATSLGAPGGGAAAVSGRVVSGPAGSVSALPGGVRAAAPAGAPGPGGAPSGAIVPALSGQVAQTPPRYGALWVRLIRFSQYQDAARLAARLAGLHPAIRREMANGEEHFTVRIGPFGFGAAGVAAADATLRQAIGAGVNDARIVVEPE